MVPSPVGLGSVFLEVDCPRLLSLSLCLLRRTRAVELGRIPLRTLSSCLGHWGIGMWAVIARVIGMVQYVFWVRVQWLEVRYARLW